MMFLGTEKERRTLISFAVVVVAGLGFVFGALVTWGVSGPTEDDLCRAQGGQTASQQSDRIRVNEVDR